MKKKDTRKIEIYEVKYNDRLGEQTCYFYIDESCDKENYARNYCNIPDNSEVSITPVNICTINDARRAAFSL